MPITSVRQRYIDLGPLGGPIDVQKLREYLLDLYAYAGLRPLLSSVSTTDATVTTLQTIPLLASTTYLMIAFVIGKRTGGSAGADTDSAGYSRRALFIRKSTGGAVLVGSVQDDLTSESQAAWDCTLSVSVNNVVLQVTGATNNNVTWSSIVTILQL